MARNTEPTNMEPIVPHVMFTHCPIRESLGIFGRKWALLVLRDIAFLKIGRFSKILKNNSGLTPRVLSMRLRDLEREGLIKRTVNPLEKLDIRYQLTKKGQDTMPILTAFIQYGMVHRAKRVFEDERARTLSQVFPEKQKPMLGELIAYAAKEKLRKLPTVSV
jgi:DNA-binding HxlR family transcriptional regulator